MRRIIILLFTVLFATTFSSSANGQSIGITGAATFIGFPNSQIGLSASMPVGNTFGVTAMGLYDSDRQSGYLTPTVYPLHYGDTDVGLAVGAGATRATEYFTPSEQNQLDRSPRKQTYVSGIAGLKVRDDTKAFFVGAQQDFNTWNSDLRVTVGVEKTF